MSEQPYSAVPRREGDIVDTNPVHEVYGAPPMDLPHGAGQPRFLGQAANNDLSVRNSFADSQYSFGQHGSEYGGSTYALNTQPYSDDPNAPSRFSNYQDDSVQMRQLDGSRDLSGKNSAYAAMATGKKTRRARWGLIVTGILIVLLIAVLVPIYFLLIKPKSKDTDSGSDSSSSSGGKGNSGSAALATSGGDGTNVVFEDGSTMKYTNSFGGQWYYDMNDPYKSTAQAQSYTPSIDKTFEFGKDRVYGVNIGGWLVTEPFIVPALYQKFHDATPKAVDEWTLMQAMGADKEKLMKEHYETFITEKDFAEIAAAGLNFVRIPVGWWAIEVRGDEPFVAGLSWTYFLKAVGWARKYGLRVNLDLHAMPGSQNGWNHSGRLGTQNFLLGPMGYANAQRGLDYIRILAEWASQDQYKDVVVIFGITNEPQGTPIGQDTLSSYYLKAYDTVRTASGTGAGAGPWVSFHDGFFSREQWKGFLAGADRIQLDDHPYMCFGGQNNNPVSSYANTPCESWGQVVANSMGDFGMTHAGEFSLATTDCGLFLNGVDLGVRYEGTYTDGGPWPRIGSCDADVTNWEQWSDSLKKDYQNLAMASMDALQNWFFWAWKIGNSTAGRVETPHWSYQLGYENGWLPKDPRTADGYCKSVNKFTGTIAQSGSGTIPDDVRANLPWPPKSINSAGDPATLPQYTPTGTLITLKGATPSITGSVSGKAAPTATKSVDVGSGWKNSNDNAGMMVEKTGCSYLDPWVGPTAAPPATC